MSSSRSFKVIMSTLLNQLHQQQHDQHILFPWVAFNQQFDAVDASNSIDAMKNCLKLDNILYVILLLSSDLKNGHTDQDKTHFVYLFRWQGPRAPTKLKANYNASDVNVKEFFQKCPFFILEKTAQLESAKLISILKEKSDHRGNHNTLGYILEKLGGLVNFRRRSSTEGASSLISMVHHELHSLDSSIRKVYDQINRTDQPIVWAMLEFDENSVLRSNAEHLVVRFSGTIGIEETQNYVKDDGLSFIFLRFAFGERRKKEKNLLITWIGSKASDLFKRLALIDLKLMKEFSFTKDIRISSKDRLNSDFILQNLRQFTNTDEVMLRVSKVDSTGSVGMPIILYIDLEHTLYEVKKLIESKLNIPVEKQRIWKTRSLNLAKLIQKQGSDVNIPLTFGRNEAGIEELTFDDEMSSMNDLELDNADRLFVENIENGDYLPPDMRVSKRRVEELSECIEKITDTGDSNSELKVSDTANSPWINYEDLIFVEADLIGRGKTASVYRAIWMVAEVAIKKWNYGRLSDSLRNAFLSEVKTLRALNHPNIVRFVGACEEPLCLVTEWVPLGSLHDLLIDSSIKITMKDVAKMALDTAYGMRYLHEKNFIHRDLKSHNLLVDEEWKIKVSDFGIARYLSEEGEALTNCGTSGWIAPEILDSVKEFNIGGYGKKADVFSYGICVWEMLTRSRINPLTGLSEEIFKAKIQSGNFLEFGKDSHPDLIEIVRDCCQFDPNLRPSFEQIVDRLERLNNIVF